MRTGSATWTLATALLLLTASGAAAGGSDYGGRKNIGVGAGLPFGGLGIHGELNPRGTLLEDIQIGLGVGGTPWGAYGSLSVGFSSPILGLSPRLQIHPIFVGVLGYDSDEKRADSKLALGDSVVFFFSKKVSLEVGPLWELLDGDVLLYAGVRWHFH